MIAEKEVLENGVVTTFVSAKVITATFEKESLLKRKYWINGVAASFDYAQVWAELLLLQAKKNYGDNKEISPDKPKQLYYKLGMTVDISLSCQLHGCNMPVPTSVLLCIKSSLSSHLLFGLHHIELGLNLLCLLCFCMNSTST